MRRIGKWLLWSTVGTLGLLICLWLVSRMRGPSVVQTEALALMQQRAPLPPGGNAFPAIWLLPYDVPESQLQAVARADYAQATVAVTKVGDGMVVERVRTGMAQFENQIPSAADVQLFCKTRDPECLDRIRADPAIYESVIERNHVLLERVVALQRYGYYRSPEFNLAAQTMLPPIQYAAYDITRLAWQFSQGQVDAALTGACDGAGAWRRLGAHSDSLMTRSISARYVEGYTGLLARMLGELPHSKKLPDSCAVAFSPPSIVDASICEAMRGEFMVSTHYIRQLADKRGVGSVPVSASGPKGLLFDPDRTLAILAAGNAWACSDTTNAALQSDLRVAHSPPRTSVWRLECVANPTGCILSDIAFPAYYNYQWQAQDHAARLELMEALLWLRTNADLDQPLQAQLMRHWEGRRRGDRQIRFEDDGATVAMHQYARGSEEWWAVPFFPEAASDTARAQAE